ncbi:MAG: AraC family transcriptional regulator [Spirochaetia bacterium]|jgi:AraC-like DNA-binding protein
MTQDAAAAGTLVRARELIDSQFPRPLDIRTLSAEARLSPYHFIRAFRGVFHDTPHQYLLRIRIQKAKELLALSTMSVTDICFEVGFESLGSFSATFHRIVGWPPTAYRARSIDQARNPRAFLSLSPGTA